MKQLTLDDAEYIRDTCRDLLEVYRPYASGDENAKNFLVYLEQVAAEADAHVKQVLGGVKF